MTKPILIGLQAPVVIHTQIVKALGSLESALYFQQLYYWSDKGKRLDGYIYKTKEEIEDETTLTRFQQDRIRKSLVSMGILDTKLIKANGAPTMHYRLNIDRMNVLIASVTTKNGLVRNLLMEKRVSYQSISKKLTNPLTENTNRDYCNVVKQPTQYRKRLQSKTSKEGEIVVSQEFHAKAQYVVAKLGTPDPMKSSVLKMCKQYPDLIDEAVSFASDATVTDKTKLFFKRMHSVKDMA